MARTQYTAQMSNDDILEISGGQVINAVPAECYAVLASKHEEAVCSYIANNKNSCCFTAEQTGNGIKVICKGESAHASTPQKAKNAITAMLEMLVTLDIKNETKNCSVIF